MEQKIRFLVIDVDGTMTDAGIYYDEHGNEMKKFCTRDGIGFLAARNIGIKLVVLTGRECEATTKRMKEMKIDYLFQNINDKYSFLKKFMENNKIKKEELAYIGDDINDLCAMQLAGFVGCPADSCIEVREHADYVSQINGGYGAVRDFIEYLLRSANEWNDAMEVIFKQ